MAHYPKSKLSWIFKALKYQVPSHFSHLILCCFSQCTLLTSPKHLPNFPPFGFLLVPIPMPRILFAHPTLDSFLSKPVYHSKSAWQATTAQRPFWPPAGRSLSPEPTPHRFHVLLSRSWAHCTFHSFTASSPQVPRPHLSPSQDSRLLLGVTLRNLLLHHQQLCWHTKSVGKCLLGQMTLFFLIMEKGFSSLRTLFSLVREWGREVTDELTVIILFFIHRICFCPLSLCHKELKDLLLKILATEKNNTKK